MSLVSVETVALDPRLEAGQSSTAESRRISRLEDSGERVLELGGSSQPEIVLEEVLGVSLHRRSLGYTISESLQSLVGISAGEGLRGGDEEGGFRVPFISRDSSATVGEMPSAGGSGETTRGGLIEKDTLREEARVTIGEEDCAREGWFSGGGGGREGEGDPKERLKSCGERANTAYTSPSSAEELGRGAARVTELVGAVVAEE